MKHALQLIFNTINVSAFQTLTRDLKEKLDSWYERVCIALVIEPRELDAENLRGMVEGSCKVNDIVGTLAWSDSKTLTNIRNSYRNKFVNSLSVYYSVFQSPVPIQNLSYVDSTRI